MILRIQFEQWVPCRHRDRSFLFFANPQNLPRIMPPETGTELAALRLVPPRLGLTGSQRWRIMTHLLASARRS